MYLLLAYCILVLSLRNVNYILWPLQKLLSTEIKQGNWVLFERFSGDTLTVVGLTGMCDISIIIHIICLSSHKAKLWAHPHMSTYLWLPTAFSVHSQMPERTADRFIPISQNPHKTEFYVRVGCVCVYLHVGEGGLWSQSDSLPLIKLCCPLSCTLAPGCPLIRHRTVWRARLGVREKTVRTVWIKLKNIVSWVSEENPS